LYGGYIPVGQVVIQRNNGVNLEELFGHYITILTFYMNSSPFFSVSKIMDMKASTVHGCGPLHRTRGVQMVYFVRVPHAPGVSKVTQSAYQAQLQ
jgi:hypothetical protein